MRMLSAPSRAPAWPFARLIAPCSALPSPGNAGAKLDRWPPRRAPRTFARVLKAPCLALEHLHATGPNASSSCPVGRSKDDDENVIGPTSREQIGACLGKPDEGSALV